MDLWRQGYVGAKNKAHQRRPAALTHGDSLEASSQTFSSEEMIETNLQCIDIARSEPRCVSIQRQARYVRPCV